MFDSIVFMIAIFKLFYNTIAAFHRPVGPLLSKCTYVCMYVCVCAWFAVGCDHRCLYLLLNVFDRTTASGKTQR